MSFTLASDVPTITSAGDNRKTHELILLGPDSVFHASAPIFSLLVFVCCLREFVTPRRGAKSFIFSVANADLYVLIIENVYYTGG